MIGGWSIRENFGIIAENLDAGQGSATGVWAAVLAEKGYGGSSTAFEGKSGFWRVYSGKNEISRWVDELNGSATLMGAMFKRYPSCAATHPASIE